MTSKQRAQLRSMANTLQPMYQIGKAGVTPAVTEQLDAALEARELIKITVLETAPESPKDTMETLAARLHAEPVQCIGISMYPTLVGGEGMFTEKLTYTVSAPQRDDIIICRYPYHTEKCVKRVIATPGDRISISDGAIYLNGERLDESAYWDGYIEGTLEEVTVPDKCLFVVGDNRNHSGDSRYASIGQIEESQVIGKVLCILFPGCGESASRDFGRIGALDNG